MNYIKHASYTQAHELNGLLTCVKGKMTAAYIISFFEI